MLSFSTGLIYFSLLFYPDAWQYSLLFSCPLVVFVYILPEHIRTFYFLVTEKPALTLMRDELVYNFKGEKYKWSEIKGIDLRANGGKAPGSHIQLHLTDSEEVIKIPDIQLKGKKFDILEDLISFHNRYGKRIEACNDAGFG
jgi:hypothetical protein